MDGEKRVKAIFDGEVLRLAEPLDLAPNTKVVLTVEVEETETALQDGVIDKVMEPTLFTETAATYIVIPEDADLREIAVDFWPKEGQPAASIRRSVVRKPSVRQSSDDGDLLVMDDLDSLQN